MTVFCYLKKIFIDGFYLKKFRDDGIKSSENGFATSTRFFIVQMTMEMCLKKYDAPAIISEIKKIGNSTMVLLNSLDFKSQHP